MLVNRIAHLVGSIEPTGRGEGFVLPVFQVQGSNGLSTQIVDSNGRVSGFEQIFPRSITDIGSEVKRTVSVGEAAICGFAEGPDHCLFEERSVLQAYLLRRIERPRDAFLQLQISEFCNALPQLAAAWRAAFRRLGDQSPRSAAAWRDMVILPAVARAAVVDTARERGLLERKGGWDSAIETSTRENRLHLALASDLFELLGKDPGARASLEQRTASVRDAFDILDHGLVLRELEDRLSSHAASRPDGAPNKFTIVALGRMAVNLVGPMHPEHERAPAGRVRKPSELRPERLEPLEPALIIHADGTSEGSRLYEIVSRAAVGEPEDLLLVFQFSKAHQQVFEAACALAEEHRSRGARVTAVIPHMPEGLFQSSGPGPDMGSRLLETFDAIWFLSDRSTYIRQSLPFGPARSIQAATSHLSFMLSHWETWSTDPLQAIAVRAKAQVTVVGSATGDRRISNLAEHAFTRLIHPEIDLTTASDAHVVLTRSSQDDVPPVKDFMLRELPHTLVRVQQHNRLDGGYGDVTIVARGVSLQPTSPARFAEMCEVHLDKLGWQVNASSRRGADFEVRKGGNTLRLDCKFDGGEGGAPYKARPGKKWRNDIVVITMAPVRRQQFVRHVLNGQVTLHYSRLSSLALVYRKRFSYVLTALRQGRLDFGRDVIPACLNWLAEQEEIRKFVAVPLRVELSSHGSADGGQGDGVYFLTLPVVAEPSRSSDMQAPVSLTVDVVIDKQGWRIVRVRPA